MSCVLCCLCGVLSGFPWGGVSVVGLNIDRAVTFFVVCCFLGSVLCGMWCGIACGVGVGMSVG